MDELNAFSTKFIFIKNIFDNKELIEILNVVKGDTKNLKDVISGDGGPTYGTSFFIKEVNGPCFTPLLEKINNHLIQNFLKFELTMPPWYSEYGEYDLNSPHIHDQRQVDLMHVGDALKYSGIINLSNFGATIFINPNPSSFSKAELIVPSNYGTVILFPSNVWHYVPSHGLRNKTRVTFSFNGLLRGLDKHTNTPRDINANI